MSLHQAVLSIFNLDHFNQYLTNYQTNSPEERWGIIINQKNEKKYTPLHSAIFTRNWAAVQSLINFGADPNLKCHGTPCLHLSLRTAILPEASEFGINCFKLFLEFGDINLLAKDDNGLSVLHLAAAFNFPEAIEALFLKISPQELINSSSKLTGLTPMHFAAFYDSFEAGSLLLKYGGSISSRLVSNDFTPLHITAVNKSTRMWSLLVKNGALDLNAKDIYDRSPLDIIVGDNWLCQENDNTVILSDGSGKKTCIFTNPLCLEHHSCPPSILDKSSVPPENLHRLNVLADSKIGILNSNSFNTKLDWCVLESVAEISDILRVHEWSYIRKLQSKCSQLNPDPEEQSGLTELDGDTTVSHKTFEAAMAAAGAVCKAVDSVVNGAHANAFCAVRPPGHHAGPKGSCRIPNGTESHGFCIFNNISIGAAYAMNRHRDNIKKVAIVDFDVHHGNGTEETVKWLTPHLETQDLINNSYFGTFYTPQYKPWYSEKDPENVLFVSVHGYGPREKGLEHLFPSVSFYPGSGPTTIPEISSENDTFNEANVDINNSKQNELEPKELTNVDEEDDEEVEMGDGDEDQNEDEDEDDSSYEGNSIISEPRPVENQNINHLKEIFEGKTHDSKEPLILDIGVSLPDIQQDEFDLTISKVINETKYRFQWRDYFRTKIFPALLQFGPDLIMISAGFDAHKKDTINAGYISLIEEDYAWLTQNLKFIANSCCQGRIVSVLEGGYQINGEYASAFAKSVAAHVESLTLPTLEHFSPERSNLESLRESNFLKNLSEQRDKEIQAKILLLQAQELAFQQSLQQEGSDNYPDSSKKRKRNQVDYASLNKELEKSSA